MPTMSTPLPPELQTTAPPPGTYLPLPAPVPSYNGQTATQIDPGAAPNPFQVADPNQAVNSVQSNLENILGSGNAYMTNANRRGLETAASRGLLNSSVAAGAAQRSAIEASMPILAQTMNLQGQREGQQFTQGESALDRYNQLKQQANQLNTTTQQNEFNRNFQGTQADADRQQAMRLQREQNAFTGEQNQLNRNQQKDMAQVQNWLDQQSYNREFYGTLAMLPIKSANDMSALLQQYAAENPEIYTQDVISGMTNFFSRNMAQILQGFFPDMVT